MEKQKCNGDCRAGEQGKAEMQWVPGGANGQHNFAGMDDWFSARNSNEHRQNALGCQRYNSVAARKRFVKETGVRWSWQGMEKQKCNGYRAGQIRFYILHYYRNLLCFKAVNIFIYEILLFYLLYKSL
ncbi:hypothetical protein RhiirA5_352441 [Rhizophagus irregularis]|uniref:Uncharacterized protein n=1 Tax=Rhizophagus irregularis TaxID=588596 RepID=A0A2N0Q192_9GLOM|nr:hypothetical protein RhiirA5_352441 [Rhizophagus irregularis]